MNPYSNSTIINFPRGPYLSWFLFQGKCSMKYISVPEISLLDITEISLQTHAAVSEENGILILSQTLQTLSFDMVHRTTLAKRQGTVTFSKFFSQT